MEDYIYAKINLKRRHSRVAPLIFIYLFFYYRRLFWNQFDPVLRDCQFENHFVIVNTSTCCSLLTEYVKSLADFVKYGGHFLL